MHRQRSRIGCSRAQEISELRRRRRDVTNAVLVQTRRRSEIIELGESLHRREIRRHRAKGVVLEPIRHGENPMRSKEIADLLLLRCLVALPALDIGRERERRHVAISLRFESFECHRAIPFLSPHCQQLLRRIRIERHVLQKEQISLAAERSLFGQRRETLLQAGLKFLERVRRSLRRIVQLRRRERRRRLQRGRHLLEARPNLVERGDRHTRKWLRRIC